jgi:hypothetical protein
MSHQPSSRSPRPRDPSFPNPESQSHADHDARHDAHGDARRTGSADGWEMVIERLTTLLLGDSTWPECPRPVAPRPGVRDTQREFRLRGKGTAKSI